MNPSQTAAGAGGLRISLIIPTRERGLYLKESLKAAVAAVDGNFEIVVSDNASTDGTGAIVRALADTRIRYVNTGRRCSMRQNFEFALSQSTGDYVIFIGDDDAILPGQLPALRNLLEQTRPDVLSWALPTYAWPIGDFSHRAGNIRFQHAKLFGAVRALDLSRLRRNLLNAEIHRLMPLPTLYHGAVARAYLETMRDPGGAVFNGSSPDIYFSYRTILNGANALYAAHPFSLNGHSPVSNGNAHQAYSQSDPRSAPARQFVAENETDPVKDALRPGHSVPLAFLSALETVRARLGDAGGRPNYLAWYRYILSANRHNDATGRKTVVDILADFAQRSGTTELFIKAAHPVANLRWLRLKAEVATGKVSRAYSFKRSAESNGKNTVLTAAEMIDRVLGDDYARVLDGERTHGQAWRAAWRRARI
jgi:glycosyltransferase involved in cell wall biosynthesis